MATLLGQLFREQVSKSKDYKMKVETEANVAYPTGYLSFDFLNGSIIHVKAEGLEYKYYSVGIVDGSMNMFIGRSGCGKTSFTTQIAANIVDKSTAAISYNAIVEAVDAFEEEDDEANKIDAVNMLTMHSSKGLEYKAVIIVNCNEGTSPHYKSLGNTKQLEEERRLFYVAMTRAKDYLFMTFPDSVLVQGQLQYAKPSRFLKEIDKQYIYKN